MKILSICYQYDCNKPGGIINKNVLSTLSKNNDVKVIAAYTNHKNIVDTELHICSPFPNKPYKIFDVLGNLLKRNIDNIFWEIKAKYKIKKLLKKWKPDVIYARGIPLAPLNIGYAISKEYNIPLMIHFSDPLPAPIEWKPEIKYRNKILNGIKPILKHADKISFVTQAMIDYEEKETKVKIKDKSIVLYNPLSEVDILLAPPSNKFTFLYIGSFYGNRKPDSLIDSFLEFSRKHQNCELHIVGNNQHLMQYHGDNIKILPFCTQPFELMKDANIMIDVDSNSDNEVFLSSKLLDYLSINRIIVSITPKRSPARELLSDLKDTVIITSHNKEEIIHAFEKALNTSWSQEIFEERKDIQENLSLNIIVNKTENELSSILEKKKKVI